MRLSICIPVYNFGKFIGETLDSILCQLPLDGPVEVLVVDGGSTDNTSEVVEQRSGAWPSLRYVRLSARGGIDVDLAHAIALAAGEYCWLFSGDDIMRAGAVERALRWLEQGYDLYLCRHSSCDKKMRWLNDHPVFRADGVRAVQFADSAERLRYLRDARTTEAVFSFMSGLLVRRAKWLSVREPAKFMGSCWGHIARLFEVASFGLKVCYVAEIWLDKRGDNDSFVDHGLVHRLSIAVDRIPSIAAHYFGEGSAEAREIRRLLRNDLALSVWLEAKRQTVQNPERESRRELDRLMTACYGDPSLSSWFVRLAYDHLSPDVLMFFRSVYRSARRLPNPAA